MSDLIYETKEQLALLTINRESKHNAFDDQVLTAMQQALEQAIANPKVRVILLQAKGQHFSAGADLAWMQRMADYTREQNQQDAMVLARLMHSLYTCPKPTIAMVQGCAYGGGAGLVAACDIAIASENARFCFSEVKLGLIPAVISPYVIKAIGQRAAKALFMSAEVIDAQRALNLQLITHCVSADNLLQFTSDYAKSIITNAPQAVMAAKTLVEQVADKLINPELIAYTAALIAEKRVSTEGQTGLQAFLNKQQPNWD